MSVTLSVLYVSASDFSFDSSVVSVSGSVATLVRNFANATCFANFSSSFSLDFGTGTLTGTGTATITQESLDLRGSSRSITWDASGNFASNTQLGTIRWGGLKPDYSGAPSSSQDLFDGYRSADDNRMLVRHDTDGALKLLVWNSASALSTLTFGAWSPTSGTSHELELNYNFTAGATRIFLNGSAVGSVNTTTLTRAENVTNFRIGRTRDNEDVPNFQLDSFAIFSSVMHTASYSAPSDRPSLYSMDDPIITQGSATYIDGLDSFSESKTASGSDNVKYVLMIDDVAKYWNGSSWVTSDGTYSQSNTAAEIHANRAALGVSTGAALKVRAFLHSEDGSTAPTLTSNTVLYNFFLVDPTEANECIVYGYLRDILGSGDVSNAKLIVTNATGFFNGSVWVAPEEREMSIPNTGKIEISLIQTATASKKYLFEIAYTDAKGQQRRERLGNATVPDQETVSITALTFT